MPDILPVGLQDLLYSRKSELREGEISIPHLRYGGRKRRKEKMRKEGRLGIRRMTGLPVYLSVQRFGRSKR